MGGILVPKKDVIESFVRASGPGGQKVNKTATCVQLIHVPTGIVVKCQEFRTQNQNRLRAWIILQEALQQREDSKMALQKQIIEKARRQKRKKSALSKERMLEEKRYRRAKKTNRQKVREDD